MRYLIIGKDGQLVKEFQRLLTDKGEAFIALAHREADVSSYLQLKEVFEQYKPDIVVNCSAYNNVDGAESAYEQAFKVNAIGPYNLALLSQAYGAYLVHYSTDYVFDGTKRDGLYAEEDEPNPLNKYGLSKRLGEALSLSSCTNAVVFRTSWVYGEGRQNFIDKVLRWAEERAVIEVSADEVSIPTWARRIAHVSYEAIKEHIVGLYHLTSTGYASRYEWAKEILRDKGIDKVVMAVSADNFALPAKKPKFSAMSNRKISEVLSETIPEWKEDMEAFMRGQG